MDPRTEVEIVEALEATQQAATALQDRLEELKSVFEGLIEAGSKGRSVATMYEQAPFSSTRDSVYAGIRDFERAFMWSRILTVRALVDEDGLSFTEVARRMGRSRQFIARMYRAGSGEDPPSA